MTVIQWPNPFQVWKYHATLFVDNGWLTYARPNLTKFFIGQVVDDHGGHTTEVYRKDKDLQKGYMDSNIFKWSDKGDIDVVSRESVLLNLSESQTDRHGLYWHFHLKCTVATILNCHVDARVCSEHFY